MTDENVKLAGDEWVVAYFDGLCEPRNPGGYACGGWLITGHPHYGEQLRYAVKGCRCYGHGEGWTNNRAEYGAALDALRAIYGAGWRQGVLLHGDSKLVVEQFRGGWTCNQPALRELLAQLRHAASFFTTVELVWIPRERNGPADALSRQAYQQARAQST